MLSHDGQDFLMMMATPQMMIENADLSAFFVITVVSPAMYRARICCDRSREFAMAV